MRVPRLTYPVVVVGAGLLWLRAQTPTPPPILRATPPPSPAPARAPWSACAIVRAKLAGPAPREPCREGPLGGAAYAVMIAGLGAYVVDWGVVCAANGHASAWAPSVPYCAAGIDQVTVERATR